MFDSLGEWLFRANASKHKAMSYGHMNVALDQIDQQIDQLVQVIRFDRNR